MAGRGCHLISLYCCLASFSSASSASLLLLVFNFIFSETHSLSSARFKSLLVPGWGEKVLGKSKVANKF